MKQYLAVEKLGRDWYQILFSAKDWDGAEQFVFELGECTCSDIELCGEVT